MAELARTPPSLRRLFQTIDLAPLPQDRTIAESLDVWRRRRGASLAPEASDIIEHQTQTVLDDSFLAEALPGTRDYVLSEVGSAARLVLGLKNSAERVSQMGARRIATRLRRLFRLAVDYGEPVIVKFIDGRRSYELLAAPVSTHGAEAIMFCTVTFDELSAGSG